jgi:hypothetical protein
LTLVIFCDTIYNMIKNIITKDELKAHLELAKTMLGDDVALYNQIIKSTGFSRNTIMKYLRKYDLIDNYIIFKPLYDRNKKRRELDQSIFINGVTWTCKDLTPLQFQSYKKYYPDKKIKRIAWAVFMKFIKMSDDFIDYVDNLNIETVSPKVNMSISVNRQDNNIVNLAYKFILDGKYQIAIQRDKSIYTYILADVYELYRYDKEEYKTYKLKYIEDTYYKYVKNRNIANLITNNKAKALRKQNAGIK